MYFGVILHNKDKRLTLNQPLSSVTPMMNNIYKIYILALQNKSMQLKVWRVVTLGARSKREEASGY